MFFKLNKTQMKIVAILILGTLGSVNAQAVDPNPALGQQTWQSSVCYQVGNVPSTSGLAVDGNTTNIDPMQLTSNVAADHKCSSTNVDSLAWWAVDLGNVMSVKSVTIYPRTTELTRIANVVVGVSNVSPANRAPLLGSYPVCGQLQGAPQSANPIIMNCDSVAPSRYVVIQLPGTNYLELCEVTVCASPLSMASC